MPSRKRAEKMSRRSVLAAGVALPIIIPRAVLGGGLVDPPYRDGWSM